MITAKYYEKLHANKFDYLEELHPSLERHDLPKLIQEEISNMNRPLSTKDIQSIIIILQSRKFQAQIDSVMNSTQ